MTADHQIHIAFFDAKPYDRAAFDRANEEHHLSLHYYESRLTPATVDLAKDKHVVCCFVNDEINAAVITALYQRGITLLALRCAGYNNVDFKTAYGKIHITHVPAYSPHAVAEHAAALMLCLNRKVHRAYNRTREGNFSLDGLTGFDLFGKCAGIIGTGKIGRSMAAILKGFGMTVLCYDPFPDESFARTNGVRYVELSELYHRADIITLHCPLTEKTRHLIGPSAFDAMKPGVMLINTSRGALIDTPALIAALKTRRIGAAGLDVYEEESNYFFEDRSGDVMDDDVLARLLTFNNVLVTSHQGFLTAEALDAIAHTTLGQIADHMTGRPLTNEVCYQCDTPKPCRRDKGQKCF